MCFENDADTLQDIHALIRDYERSISSAKLAGFSLPQTHLLTSPLVDWRYPIPNDKTFTTVQEIELREYRARSIIDHGEFFSTARAEDLGLTSASLIKHKANLRRAMALADRLGDVEAEPETIRTQRAITVRLDSLLLHNNTYQDPLSAWHDALYQGRVEYVKAVHARQADILRGLSDLDLALLHTLREAAMVGWRRYMAAYAEVDPWFRHKTLAFGEMVLCKGGLAIWAFLRGTGSVLLHHDRSLLCLANRIAAADGGSDEPAAGVTTALFRELRCRLVAAAVGRRRGGGGPPDSAAAELEGLVGALLAGGMRPQALEGSHRLLVTRWVYRLIRAEIGCKKWIGYNAVRQSG